MKNYLAATLSVLTSLCLLFSLGSLQAHADTVSLNFASVGGQSDGGYYVYPYNFSIDGSKTTTPLMCISFTQEVNPGDSWNATIQSITGAAEEEAAWLFNDANLHEYPIFIVLAVFNIFFAIEMILAHLFITMGEVVDAYYRFREKVAAARARFQQSMNERAKDTG